MRPVLGFLIAASGPTALAALPPESVEFFEKKIRPVLVAECHECHGAEKQKGGLRLDYRDGWKAGGDSGAAIIPGDPAKSLFLRTIRHEDPDLKMPSKAPKLSDAVIADFEKWIAMGAPDPRDEPAKDAGPAVAWEHKLEERRKWWSFQPVRKPEPPAPKLAPWSTHPVDRFLLAKMEERGLTPAADADPRTVYRRLSYVLTGLPPRADELADFETAARKDFSAALADAADRMLASTAYGERWARHWMDLMRYAETHGSEGDPEIPEAWRFRDYLIRAFNDDVPYNDFIREQLAGDLLTKPRWNDAEGFNESIIGPAHLRLVEHGFQPVDTLDEQVKTIDNQIDVIGKTFQALTISCARCHDHKFDPISQRDFTALYGVLASVRPAQVTINSPEDLRRNAEELTALKKQVHAGLAQAWKKAAEELGQQLLQEPARAQQIAQQRKKIQELERKVATLDAAALRRIQPSAVAVAALPPTPLTRWTFADHARDSLGGLHGELLGGAEVRNGRLILNGKGAYLRTGTLPYDLRAKTLEAWVTLSNVEQRGGGVVAVETIKTHGFDALVFAEKDPRQWVAGSDFFRRSRVVDGPPENTAGQQVHVAVAYREDGTVSLYRNGQPYGQPYKSSGPLAFGAGDSRVLLGLRHTGAGNGFLAGEIEEARLYDQALSASEIAASFQAGTTGFVSREQIAAALTPEERKSRATLEAELTRKRDALQNVTAGANGSNEDPWRAALNAAANDPTSPLRAWSKLAAVERSNFRAAWDRFIAEEKDAAAKTRAETQQTFTPKWNLGGTDYARWFRHGSGLTATPSAEGDFAIDPAGDAAVHGLFPAGAMTHSLSPRHNGLLTSPHFQITTNNISVRVAGAGGAQVRVIVDNYPLGSNNSIFARATIEKADPHWIRLDTEYRKGTWAYLEFTTEGDATRSAGKPKTPEANSWFWVDQVVFHDTAETPKEPATATALLASTQPASTTELAQAYARTLSTAVDAWAHGNASPAQREFLDYFVRRGLLPTRLSHLGGVNEAINTYRREAQRVATPSRVPGVLDVDVIDAPFMERGDHLKPGEPVPRGFLAVLHRAPFSARNSGRLELADAITDPKNPLTARVLVNRVWHHVYGRGIVSTVDNFGRLGEAPTHPELLDYLATRFVEEGWSVKKLLRTLVTSRAFRLSTTPTPAAAERDANNDFLSHARVRRLDAEALRDTLLTVGGTLDRDMFGRPVGNEANRRSIYLPVRRNALNPFLTIFDAPKPFTTLGRRDATNVPAQSLALLNDPFVIRCASDWAQRNLKSAPGAPLEKRVDALFTEALARPASPQEQQLAAAYVAELQQEHQGGPDHPAVLRDLAQSVFNLKEFIYLR